MCGFLINLDGGGDDDDDDDDDGDDDDDDDDGDDDDTWRITRIVFVGEKIRKGLLRLKK